MTIREDATPLPVENRRDYNNFGKMDDLERNTLVSGFVVQ